MPKPLVFISHITEEKDVALALKTVIEDAFLNLFDVFVSSDGASIQAGGKWLDNISNGLKACVIEFVICSPQSIKRPWINFEAGAGWVREIPVIPVCHSGMSPSDLPIPLKMLQAVSATDETQLRLMLPVVSYALSSRVPNVDFSPFVARVKAFEEKYIFWDILKGHIESLAERFNATAIDLNRALHAITCGERPFANYAGGVAGTPGMCLDMRGNLDGDVMRAATFFEQQRIFRLKVFGTTIAIGSQYAGPVTGLEVLPLERFDDVFGNLSNLS